MPVELILVVVVVVELVGTGIGLSLHRAPARERNDRDSTIERNYALSNLRMSRDEPAFWGT
jgi:hypothetical protein